MRKIKCRSNCQKINDFIHFFYEISTYNHELIEFFIKSILDIHGSRNDPSIYSVFVHQVYQATFQCG